MDYLNPLNNTFLLLFISWSIGAITEPLLRRWIDYREVQNYVLRKSRFYRLIRVTLLRSLIIKAGLNCNSKLKTIPGRSLKSLMAVRQAMTEAEIGHWIGFAAMLLATFWAFLLHASVMVLLSHMAVNVLGNVYPCLLQQYNRRRLDVLIRKAQERESAESR